MADFLINYEHKARELDSICLIKTELERRGYSVDLSCTYDEERTKHKQRRKAKVVLTSALYNNSSLHYFVYSLAGFCRKVVNLQWEQSLTIQDESDPNFYQNPKEYARDALHLCWGVEVRNRLSRSGVSSKKAIVVGPSQMDILRPEFNDLFLDKDDIARMFNLNRKFEWVLFISSFTFVNMTDEEYNRERQCMGDRLDDFRHLSIVSKQEIVKWLELALIRYPDKTYIYRPHPSENGDDSLITMATKYPNFYIIKDLSVKQWIRSSDKILTWYSTSVAEVFFSGKSCSILRPIPIPNEWEVSIYRNATLISDPEVFICDLADNNGPFPLDEVLVREYYQVKNDSPSYCRICDVLEDVINTKEFDMPRKSFLFVVNIHFIQMKTHFLFIIKQLLSRSSYEMIFFWNRFLVSKLDNHIESMSRLNRDRGKNQASEEELAEIFEKIRRVLNAVKHG